MSVSPSLQSLLTATILGFAWLSLLLLLWRGGRDRAERHAFRGALALSAAAAGGVLALVDPGDVPLTWLTPLQEGDTAVVVDLALGVGAHVGPAAERGYELWTGPGLAEAARTNLAFTVAALPLLWVVVRGICGSGLVAAVLTAGWLGSPLVLAHATSEGLAPATWFWTAAIGVAALVHPSAAGTTRTVSILLLGLAPAVMALHREELGLIGLGVAVAALVPASRRPVPVVLMVALIAVGALIAPLGVSSLQTPWRWFAAAADPRQASIVQLPVFLGAVFGPGLAVCMVAGLVRSLRWPATAMGAGLACVVLARVFHASAHGGVLGSVDAVAHGEMIRYGGYLAAWLLVGAADVWRLLPHGRIRFAVLAAALVPASPELMARVPGNTAHLWGAVALPPGGRLAQDPQVEVRAWVGLRRRFPDCAIVTPLAEPRQWLVVGPVRVGQPAGLDELRRSVEAAGPAEAAAVYSADCVLLVEGLVCARHPGRCRAHERAPLGGMALEGRPWNHPKHGLPSLPAWGWNVYLVDGPAN